MKGDDINLVSSLCSRHRSGPAFGGETRKVALRASGPTPGEWGRVPGWRPPISILMERIALPCHFSGIRALREGTDWCGLRRAEAPCDAKWCKHGLDGPIAGHSPRNQDRDDTMEQNANAMQLHLDNRPGNVQRTSRLLTALLMLAVLPLWPTLSFAGVEAIRVYLFFQPGEKVPEEERPLVSGSMRSFLKFNLATLPSGMIAADVEKATLKLFASKRRKAGSFDVFAVTGPWSEQSITHSTAPGLADHAETGGTGERGRRQPICDGRSHDPG
jgi:hypothetical protein